MNQMKHHRDCRDPKCNFGCVALQDDENFTAAIGFCLRWGLITTGWLMIYEMWKSHG